MKRILLLVLLLAFAAALPAGAAQQVNKVAAVVNGKLITMFDLQRAASADLAREGLKPDSPKDKEKIDQVLRKVLDALILDKLLEQEATRLKITVSDADVDQEITRMYQARGMNRQQFEQALAKQHLSLAEMRKNVRMEQIRGRIMNMEVSRRVVVTPEEIKAYYEQHQGDMLNRLGLRMALIVYNPNAPIAQLAKKLQSGDLNWLEVSKRYSLMPNKDQGGDQGEVPWDQVKPDDRLMKLQPGQVSDLFNINGQFKAQVRLYRANGDNSPIRPMTLEEATPYIDAKLRGPKAQERFEDYVKQLRAKAVIDIRL